MSNMCKWTGCTEEKQCNRAVCGSKSQQYPPSHRAMPFNAELFHMAACLRQLQKKEFEPQGGGGSTEKNLFVDFFSCYSYDFIFFGSSSFLECGTEAEWGNWFSVWQHCEKQPIIKYKYGLWRDSVVRKGKQKNTFVCLFEMHKPLCQSGVDFWNINLSIYWNINLSIYLLSSLPSSEVSTEVPQWLQIPHCMNLGWAGLQSFIRELSTAADTSLPVADRCSCL